jgi:hypothetical protein
MGRSNVSSRLGSRSGHKLCSAHAWHLRRGGRRGTVGG